MKKHIKLIAAALTLLVHQGNWAKPEDRRVRAMTAHDGKAVDPTSHLASRWTIEGALIAKAKVLGYDRTTIDKARQVLADLVCAHNYQRVDGDTLGGFNAYHETLHYDVVALLEEAIEEGA